MRITTKAEYRWNGARYVMVRWEGFQIPDGASEIALCKGPSANEQSVANSQKGFMDTLQQDYGTTFANQQTMLNNLSNSLKNTVANGPGQYGFSAQEDAALRTQADSGTAASYRNAKQALGEATAATGGGNAVLPTGATSEAQAQLAQAAAQQQSNQQLGITTTGYQQGNQNYNNAVNGLEQVANLENPNAVAGNATSASSTAFNSANTVSQQQNASSPWNIVGGILGGAAGSLVNGFTGNLGGGLASSALGVMGGGGSSVPSITAGGTGEGKLGNPFSTSTLSMPGMSNEPINLSGVAA